jgi:hypothetical protein
LGDRDLPGLIARRVDRIQYSLGLDEIEFIVEERTSGELAAIGEARAQFDENIYDAFHDQRIAVNGYFNQVFAGVRTGAKKENCDRVIDRLSGSGIDDPAVINPVRFKSGDTFGRIENLPGKRDRIFSADADHGQPGITHGRGRRDDRIAFYVWREVR